MFLTNTRLCICCSLRPVNEGRSAVPCAYSYFLFEPEDQVMEQNLRYYKAYSEEWGLRPDHFTPRKVRGKLCPDITVTSATWPGCVKIHCRCQTNTETRGRGAAPYCRVQGKTGSSPNVLCLFYQEALKHYNQTVTQKQMLTFAEKYLKLADEVRLKPF